MADNIVTEGEPKDIKVETKEFEEEKPITPIPSHLSKIKKTSNKLFLLLVKSYHIFISILALVAPYITSHVPTLLFLVIYYSLIITLWYIFKGCIFTDLENHLEKTQLQYNTSTNTVDKEKEEFKVDTYEDGTKKSFITTQMEYFLGEGSEKYISLFMSLVPFINTTVSCVKIFMNVKYNDLY
jgi:hypothetical protein